MEYYYFTKEELENFVENASVDTIDTLLAILNETYTVQEFRQDVIDWVEPKNTVKQNWEY